MSDHNDGGKKQSRHSDASSSSIVVGDQTVNLEEEFMLLFGDDDFESPSAAGRIYDPSQVPAQQTQQRVKYHANASALNRPVASSSGRGNAISARVGSPMNATQTTTTSANNSFTGTFAQPLPRDSGVLGSQVSGGGSFTTLQGGGLKPNSSTAAEVLELKQMLASAKEALSLQKQEVQNMQNDVYTKEGENSILRGKLKDSSEQFEVLRNEMRNKNRKMSSSQNDLQTSLAREMQQLQSQLAFRKRDLEEAEATIRRLKREGAALSATQQQATPKQTPSQRTARRAPGQPNFVTPQRPTQTQTRTPQKSQSHTHTHTHIHTHPRGYGTAIKKERRGDDRRQSVGVSPSQQRLHSPTKRRDTPGQDDVTMVIDDLKDDLPTTQVASANEISARKHAARLAKETARMERDARNVQMLIPKLLRGPPRPVYRLCWSFAAYHEPIRLQRYTHPSVREVQTGHPHTPAITPAHTHTHTRTHTHTHTHTSAPQHSRESKGQPLRRCTYERRWACDFGVLDLLSLAQNSQGWHIHKDGDRQYIGPYAHAHTHIQAHMYTHAQRESTRNTPRGEARAQAHRHTQSHTHTQPRLPQRHLHGSLGPSTAEYAGGHYDSASADDELGGVGGIGDVSAALIGVTTGSAHLSRLLQLFDRAMRAGMCELRRVLVSSKDKQKVASTAYDSVDAEGYSTDDERRNGQAEAFGNTCIERMAQVVLLLTMVCRISAQVRRLIVTGHIPSNESHTWETSCAEDTPTARARAKATALKNRLHSRGVVFGNRQSDIDTTLLSQTTREATETQSRSDTADTTKDTRTDGKGTEDARTGGPEAGVVVHPTKGPGSNIATVPTNHHTSRSTEPTTTAERAETMSGMEHKPSDSTDTAGAQFLIRSFLLELASIEHIPLDDINSHTTSAQAPATGTLEEQFEPDYYKPAKVRERNTPKENRPRLRPFLIHEVRQAALQCLSVCLLTEDAKDTPPTDGITAATQQPPHAQENTPTNGRRYERLRGWCPYTTAHDTTTARAYETLLSAYVWRVVPAVHGCMRGSGPHPTRHAGITQYPGTNPGAPHTSTDRAVASTGFQDNYCPPLVADDMSARSLTVVLETLMALAGSSVVRCHGNHTAGPGPGGHKGTAATISSNTPATAAPNSQEKGPLTPPPQPPQPPVCLYACGLTALRHPLTTADTHTLHLRALQYLSTCVCLYHHTAARAHSEVSGVSVSMSLSSDHRRSVWVYRGRAGADPGETGGSDWSTCACNCVLQTIYRLVQALMEYERVLTMDGSLPFPDDIAHTTHGTDAEENERQAQDKGTDGTTASDWLTDSEADNDGERAHATEDGISRQKPSHKDTELRGVGQGLSVVVLLREALRLLERLCESYSRISPSELVEWIRPFQLAFYTSCRRIVLLVRSQRSVYPEGTELHDCMVTAQSLLQLYNELSEGEGSDAMEDITPSTGPL